MKAIATLDFSFEAMYLSQMLWSQYHPNHSPDRPVWPEVKNSSTDFLLSF
jgi:hypothetical protein